MKILLFLRSVPDNYKILFLQGGATGQFSAIPMNFMKLKESETADYFITGTWSAKAFKEVSFYGFKTFKIKIDLF